MEQLSLDLGITNIDDAMTDRQTDRSAADAGGENRTSQRSNRSCGGYEQEVL